MRSRLVNQGGRGCNGRWLRQHSSVHIDREIFSMVYGHSFPFCYFKKDSFQFLANECVQVHVLVND